MAGKADWMARGLALEGDKAGEPRAIDFAARDVVTCGLRDTIGALRERVAGSPYGFAFVVGEDGVLLGRLRRAALEGDPRVRAEDVMEPGPSTSRPDMPPAQLLAKLDRAQLRTAVLTDPEGRLLGVVRRDDLAPFAEHPS
jgi:CBS domain-containing protein